MAMDERELNDHYLSTPDRLRVKVFIYFADQWREKGIGFLGVTKIENDEKSYQIYEDYYKSNNNGNDESNIEIASVIYPIYKLTVRSQQDMHERLISTYITNSIDYRVQEGSILTWKEGEHEKALSFECIEDCSKFMKIVADIRQIISNFNPSNTLSNEESIKTKDIGSYQTHTIVDDDDNDKMNDNEEIDENDWEFEIVNPQICSNDLDKIASSRSDDEFALNDNSSIWQEDRLPILPVVSVDNLDKWIRLLSFSNVHMSNLCGGIESSTKSKSDASLSMIDDSNQLYQYISTNNTLKEFFKLFHHYETEEHYELDILFKLYHIFKGFIATDNFDIYRLMFEESISTTLDVIGILEYDSTMETRIHHRDYLKNKAKFRKFFLLDSSVTNKFPTSPVKTNSLIDESAPLSKEPSLNTSIDVDTLIQTLNNDIKSDIESDISNKSPQKESKIQTNDNPAESEINDTKQTTLEHICEKATLIYYIQYIIDHIMPTPSIFDEKLDPMTTYLNHHKADLCNLIYDNTMLLHNLFLFLTNGNGSKQLQTNAPINNNSLDNNEKQSTLYLDKPTLNDYIDSVFFLHEFCLLSNSLSPSDKEFFFHWLESYNLLDVLSSLMKEPNVKIRTKVVDIISLLVDNKASTVREFNLAQIEKVDEFANADVQNKNVCLMDHLIDTIIDFHEDPVSLHCTNVINLLMDNDVINNTDISYLEKMDLFCVSFFNYSFEKFLKRFICVIDGAITTFSNTMLLDRLLSLLTRWVNLHHDLLISKLVNENVIGHVTSLMDFDKSFIVCGVVRLIRKLLELKDNLINEEFHKYETIEKVTDVFVNTCLRSNNLLNNTILELFNYIIVEDIDTFYASVVVKHREIFLTIEYIDTFKRIITRYDIYVNKLEGGGVSLSLDSVCSDSDLKTHDNNNSNSNSNPNLSGFYNSVRKRKSYEFESSEERWFDTEDNNDVTTQPNVNNVNEMLNKFLFENDDLMIPATKKRKSSPIKVDIVDEVLSTNNNVKPKSPNVDDENLFDLLIGNVSKKTNNNDSNGDINSINNRKNDFNDEEDIFDLLSRGQPKIIQQIYPQGNKRPNLIKIHTNKFNSPRNLVMASNSKSSSGDEHYSIVDDDSPVKSQVSVNDNSPNTSNINPDCDDNNGINLIDNTFDITKCLVETTLEDDSDISVLNDEHPPDNNGTI